jgi:glycosyltransferase involved in cell wall biosynthesis
MRLLFILPGGGGTGGAHSVVQEAVGLTRMGAAVALAVSRESAETFAWHYPELKGSVVAVHNFGDMDSLAALLPGVDLAIATSAPSALMLADALGRTKGKAARPAYYVQDYEPLIFAPGTPKWEDARASYSALKGALLFAKTDWLRRIVHDNHGRQVVKVQASIDHAVYRPLARPEWILPAVSAMIRPKTPRRGPERTVRILERLADLYGERLRLVTFGCPDEDLAAMANRPSRRIEHRGVLRRAEVAQALNATELFLDLSDYQAFGRTGLEAMACACVPVLPVFGGADEFARHWDNAILVDTRSDEAIMEACCAYLDGGPEVWERMRDHGIATALDYTVEKAAFSEYQAFSTFLGQAS